MPAVALASHDVVEICRARASKWQRNEALMTKGRSSRFQGAGRAR